MSVTTWACADRLAGAVYQNKLAPFWNGTIYLVFFFVFIWLVGRLRSSHTELEDRVRQRTVALTNEIAERVRLEKEILEISEREQRRIGHDLHDSLCQHLTGTALAGQVLQGKLEAKALPEANDADKMVSLVEEGITLARNMARGLSPIHLEGEGLMAAFEELAAMTSARFNIHCEFGYDAPLFVNDPVVATHLYRIAQEATSNALRHGKATSVAIRLKGSGNDVVLTVEDNGVGFTPDLASGVGMGLHIMSHRSSMIGGALEVRPASPGAIVMCRFSRRAHDAFK
jgi:signal transduction histidine kinase